MGKPDRQLITFLINPDRLIFDLIHSRRHNRLQNRYSNLKFLSIIGVEIFRHKTV